MDLQKAFDIAYNGVVNQGKPSQIVAVNAQKYICAFHGEEGTHCAIGHLLVDISMESEDIFDEDCRNFIDCLRECHDNAAELHHATDPSFFIVDFKSRMKLLAKQFNLVTQ